MFETLALFSEFDQHHYGLKPSRSKFRMGIGLGVVNFLVLRGKEASLSRVFQDGHWL